MVANACQIRRRLGHVALRSRFQASSARCRFVGIATEFVSTVRELESVLLAWLPCIFVGHAASDGFSSKVAEVSLRAVQDCSRMKALRSSRIARFSGSHMSDCVYEVALPVEFKGPHRCHNLEDYVGGIDRLVSARFMVHKNFPVSFEGLCQVLGVDMAALPTTLSAVKLGRRLWPWTGVHGFEAMLACATVVRTIWHEVGWVIPDVCTMHPWSRLRLFFSLWQQTCQRNM